MRPSGAIATIEAIIAAAHFSVFLRIDDFCADLLSFSLENLAIIFKFPFMYHRN
ncbi:MAG: hypothetical protein LBJ95_00475 [Oscillospiraceae bacterium]|nr:hypothetical protein [Oscillospiraceae bacterium]